VPGTEAAGDDEAPATADHPLSALSGAEIEAARACIKASGRLPEGSRFAYVGLEPPPKAAVRAFSPGNPVVRRVRAVVVTGPEDRVDEIVVSVTDKTIERWETVEGVRPALLFEEAMGVIEALKADPRFEAAMAARGITDLDRVQIDPWPSGTFGLDHERGRRISRCIPYYRETPEANGYARPIEGVLGFVDLGRAEVLEVLDTGVVPLAPEAGSYYPEDNGPLRADVRPLEIAQPDGPSFTVEGNLICWQRWSLRVSLDPIEGLVLHTVGYDDAGRVRPILHRASVTEMVVPYGSPDILHAWKSAFDAGEWGLGRMANSLALGCDCLGEIHYFDVAVADERGHAHTLANAICLHEEDYSILWKHVDMMTGRTEVRRSRRLVVSSIATVGNYEYAFYWYFYMDGTMQLEVKLTGIMSTQGFAPGYEPTHATVVAPGLAAPVHQHMFNVRLDMEVDGPQNSVYETETRADLPGPDNPWGNAFSASSTLLETESAAQRSIDVAASRSWKVVNRSAANGLGQPTGYRLVPAATPTLLADPGSSVGRRAAFARHNLWVTPFSPDERRAAGDYPNQHEGGDGLERWTAADRSIVDTDLVLWYTFGVTHVPRPEDWPVMPVESTGFSLVASGFFDRNPALDIPPSSATDCHSG
jgi:primary-amine oxidase